MVITVDGPAAAGKSTVALRLARRLGFLYLDTGAMYRAVTHRALQAGMDMADPCALARAAEQARIELEPADDGLCVRCDGVDVTRAIRTAEVTRNIYRVADEPAARRVLIEKQREFGRRHDVVAEGRDQGTEVFPGAEVKFYLDASVEERAARRLKDLRRGGGDASEEEVRRELAERDTRDRSRPVGALRRQGDMVVIDSTDMTVDEVVAAMVAEIRRRRLLPDRA
ncbi:MAG: (d)CMP kinase [Planctomycetota bacterium]